MAVLKKIAVLTSGGDAPGMNAAIRAVVRRAIKEDIKVVGVMRGYDGLVKGDFVPLLSKSVSSIIQLGGTILKTARSKEFMTPEGRQIAYNNLVENEIDALVVIGGDGTFKGARIFTEEFNFPTVGIPGTIDNDLFGTDMTIGYDTALNTVVEAVDKIRDTAASHERVFLIEVMGRDAGFIALRAGIACGAEDVLIPETPSDLEGLHERLTRYIDTKKTSSVILVAEGDEEGGAFEIKEKMSKFKGDYELRVTVLGHIQRGGSPSAYDRYLASRLGIGAVEALIDDQRSIMIGMINREVVHVPFNKTTKHHKTIDQKMVDIVEILNA
ncbi:MAG TPA: 6-phosphofructokinase [Bacteroidales bacterium]|nr:6-phosphofructokinase [Bacteroidales bacterium]HPL04849.1 6-phosphofructokinase [Bacteroidales bacterium]